MAPKSSSRSRNRKSVKPYSKEPSPPPKDETSNKNNNNNNNKALFQRIWSESDEIELLKGLKTFLGDKKSHFDLTDFHKFIHKSLSFHVTVTQLSEKLRRMKKNYKKNATKAKTFSKPHDQLVFDLSTNIWSVDDSQQGKHTPDVAVTVTVAPAPAAAADGNVKASFSGCDLGLGDGSVDAIVKKGLSLLGNDSKVVELEEKWKELHIAELELFLKKVELIRDQIMVALETCKTG